MGFIYGWANPVNEGVGVFLFFNKTPHLIKNCFDVDIAIDIIRHECAKRFCCTFYEGNTHASKKIQHYKIFDVTNNNWNSAFQQLKEYCENSGFKR